MSQSSYKAGVLSNILNLFDFFTVSYLMSATYWLNNVNKKSLNLDLHDNGHYQASVGATQIMPCRLCDNYTNVTICEKHDY